MICPKCGGLAKVLDVRPNDDEKEVYRKYKCCRCDDIFYTLEYRVDFQGYYKKRWSEINRTATFRKRKKENEE